MDVSKPISRSGETPRVSRNLRSLPYGQGLEGEREKWSQARRLRLYFPRTGGYRQLPLLGNMLLRIATDNNHVHYREDMLLSDLYQEGYGY